MSRYKLVVFDLDGTLLNTLEDLAESVNYALKACGYPTHPVEQYPYFVGNGVRSLIKRALPSESVSDAIKDKVLMLFFEHYKENLTNRTHPYTGIEELLTSLKKRGYSLAVASNKFHEGTVALVNAYFPQIEFCQVMGHEEEAPRKPDPYILNTIMKRTGFTAAETVFVGDSGIDMETAFRANVTGVGVSWGFQDEEEMWTSGAFAVVDTIDRLLAVIERN